MIKKILDKIFWNLNTVKYAKEQGMKIGEGCRISSRADIGTEPYLIELGNHVEITNNCHLITHDGGLWSLRYYCKGPFEADEIHKYGKIKIGDNSYLGIGTIVLPGVTIGKNCVIGAGSVVTKDIQDNSVCAGVPARFIETIEEYAEKCKKGNLDWDNENYRKNKKEEILKRIK